MTGNPSPDAWPLQADHLPSQAIEACLICFSVGRGLALRLPINPPFDSRSGPVRALHTTDRHGDDSSSSRFNGESNLRLIVVLPPVRCSTTHDSPDSSLMPPFRPADCRFSSRPVHSLPSLVAAAPSSCFFQFRGGQHTLSGARCSIVASAPGNLFVSTFLWCSWFDCHFGCGCESPSTASYRRHLQCPGFGPIVASVHAEKSHIHNTAGGGDLGSARRGQDPLILQFCFEFVSVGFSGLCLGFGGVGLFSSGMEMVTDSGFGQEQVLHGKELPPGDWLTPTTRLSFSYVHCLHHPGFSNVV
eukprot:scaffold71097_cov55-Cyclotella_meneghiniana.AAC.3